MFGALIVIVEKQLSKEDGNEFRARPKETLMANDPVTEALNSAKGTLEKANRLTESVEGNPTSTFAPKKPEPPKVPQARKPSYNLASQARALVSGFGNVAQGLKNRQENVQQYTDASK